jgi:hypothetical protein
MSVDDAVTVAQTIVNSVTDIRPSLRGKIVATVEGNHLRVKLVFTDGSFVYLTGLYAKRVSYHLRTML